MTAQPKRRWYQFGLRSLLVFMTVAGFGLGYIGHERRLAQQQLAAEAALVKQGIKLLGFQKDYRAGWLRRILGDDSAGRKSLVVFRPGLAASPPAVMDQVWPGPSASVNATLPTTVPMATFSSTLKVWSFTTGASLALLRLMVIVFEPVRFGVPLSVTSTVRLNVGLVSKSTAAELATVISPVDALMANAPPVLPPLMANV
jgi:hypothetical protein